MKTAIVLGAAYGGSRAAQILAAGIPKGWRILLIDRNSHAHHVYVLPRFSVFPGHEHKAFIPYHSLFQPPKDDHLVLRATVLSLTAKSVTLSRSFPEHGIDTPEVPYDYSIYALGSHLPVPLGLWGTSEDRTYDGTKAKAIQWLKEKQKVIERAGSVLVVGGGALGIQFATDIAAVYPSKKITLLHSRNRLLPRFDERMHLEILQSLESLGIDVILGERLETSSADKYNEAGQRVVSTLSGRDIATDLMLLCTGQKPNTALLKDMDPNTVDVQTGLARVLRTLQLSDLKTDPDTLPADLAKISLDGNADPVQDEGKAKTHYPHIFAIGDAADAFGAIKAGHNAYFQGEVAARNVLRLINDSDEPLELYTPGLPAIKVSLGLTRGVYQVDGVIGVNNDGVEDLQAPAVWAYYGIQVEGEDGMYD
ncbi:FAD/NAD(P)-binding domain-containing protein [Armillaria solidipes]|uniref:FAD/NAD(P)-binding domain-containing protein n=1 Tax=Armillaria solidipes TaxID=1076256 RepID=A0A2H3BVB5_9AGAR|nr:FAD/NAD(P)-binding domain-containing protein [Armillaria solidipes]